MGHQPSGAAAMSRSLSARGQALGDTDALMGDPIGSRSSAVSAGLTNQPRLRAYLMNVKAINDARLKNIPLNPIALFSQTASNLAVDSQQQVLQRCWMLIESMLGSKRSLNNISQGHFAAVYRLCEDSGTSDQATAFRSQLIRGARAWLQKMYRNWVSETVRNEQLEIGGMPSVVTEVDALIKSRLMRNGRYLVSWIDTSISGKPFWAQIFMLVRMGLYDDALKHINQFQAELSKTSERNFGTYFKAWMDSPDGRLPKPHRDKLNSEWNAGIRDYIANTRATPKGDVFKHILYKIIGRCDMNVKSARCTEVISTAEDYLWFHLMLVQEEILPGDSANERYTLRDFSSAMQKFGIAQFKERATWFMVLLLAGEFEKAVSELMADPTHQDDALHFAITLAYYGVLRVPDNPSGTPIGATFLNVRPVVLSTGTQYEVAYFHLAKAINAVVRQLSVTSPLDALQYILLLGMLGRPLDNQSSATYTPRATPDSTKLGAMSSGRDYTRYAHSRVRELVLACNSHFPALLGEVRPDGVGRSPGQIEVYRTLLHLETENDYMQYIVLEAARTAENDNHLNDSILLYHLAGQYDKNLTLLNANLGEKLLQQTFYQIEQSDASMDGFGTFGSLAGSTAGSVSGSATTGRTVPMPKTIDQSMPALALDTDPIETTSQILRFYQSRPMIAVTLNPQTVATTHTLIQLSRFRLFYDQGRDEAALRALYNLNILPTTGDVVAIQSYVDAFLQLDESVARVIPHLILLAIFSIYRLFKQLTDKRSGGAGYADPRVTDLRTRSKALLMFASLIQYRISGDVFAKMNRIDVMMG
eukprot:jgi/Hompol1/5514/HPOL_002269-RA